jgi:Lipopolysaccharide export system permease LptF/LptG
VTRPGETLRSIAQRFCTPATMERLIDPVIADLQCEHADAVVHRRVWHARWIRVAGYVAFWKVAVIGVGRASTGALMTPHDGAIDRTIRFSGLATTALTLVFMWPSVWTFLSHPGHRLAIFLTLVPSAMSVALPMGIVVGVLCGLRGRVATSRVRQAIVSLAVVCSLAMFVNLGWILPASNQAFREVTAGRRVAPGTNELALGDLRQLARDRFVIPLIASRRAFDLHFRVALAFAPLALGLFALGVSGVRRRAAGLLTVGVLGFAACFVYYLLLYCSRAVMYQAPFEVSEHIPPIIAAWASNLVFLVPALLLHLRTRGRTEAGPSGLEGAPLAHSETTHQTGR